MELEAGSYITRTGQLLVISEEVIKSGVVRLVAAGPQIYELGMLDEETGKPVQISLNDGDLLIETGSENGTILCRPHTGDVAPFSSTKGDAELFNALSREKLPASPT